MQNLQLDHASHRPAATRLPLRILAHDLALPVNVGGLFRLADALGVECLHLTGSTPVPPDVRLRRAARATEAVVPYETSSDPLAVVAVLRAAGWRIVALELSTLSVDLRKFVVAPADRICLVLGTENHGVPQALLDAVDATVHLPMRGRNSSMNVITACAIAAFELGGRLSP